MTDLPTRQEVEDHARHTIRAMTSWACEEFGFHRFHPVDLNITFQSNWNRSWAGRGRRDGRQHGVLRLHLYQFTRCASLGHYEYADFADDLDIGGFTSDDWKLNLDGLIAHEFSHVIQYVLPYWHNKWGNPGKSGRYGVMGLWEGGHGLFFQTIYRKVRREFVNSRLDLHNLANPCSDFDVEILPSDLAGKRVGNLVIIGRRPRARIYRYWARDLEDGDLVRVSAGELMDLDSRISEHLRVDLQAA